MPHQKHITVFFNVKMPKFYPFLTFEPDLELDFDLLIKLGLMVF